MGSIIGDIKSGTRSLDYGPKAQPTELLSFGNTGSALDDQ